MQLGLVRVNGRASGLPIKGQRQDGRFPRTLSNKTQARTKATFHQLAIVFLFLFFFLIFFLTLFEKLQYLKQEKKLAMVG